MLINTASFISLFVFIAVIASTKCLGYAGYGVNGYAYNPAYGNLPNMTGMASNSIYSPTTGYGTASFPGQLTLSPGQIPSQFMPPRGAWSPVQGSGAFYPPPLAAPLNPPYQPILPPVQVMGQSYVPQTYNPTTPFFPQGMSSSQWQPAPFNSSGTQATSAVVF